MSTPDLGPLAKFVVRRVHETIGSIPVHVPGLAAERDFVGVEASLPLIVLWDEKDNGDNFAFRTWVNWDKLVEVAHDYDGPREEMADPVRVRAELIEAFNAVQKVSTAAIYDLAGRKGQSPSRVCDDYWFRDAE